MDLESSRIIDANLNRIGEGLRVVEDIVRFVLNDGPLQQRLKRVRHTLTTVPVMPDGLDGRCALGDAGRFSHGQREYDRRGLPDVLKANFRRIEEGLRVLEEILKLGKRASAEMVKNLRYEIYDIEQKAMGQIARPHLRRGLYLVLSNPEAGYERLTEMAVKATIAAVQFRPKAGRENNGKAALPSLADDREALHVACSLRAITNGTKTLFIVNDRPDIAVLSEADGVHVGQDDLPPCAVRRLIGGRKLLGLSTHNLDQAQASAIEPVDYIGFGPLYETDSKAVPDPVVGPALLSQAAALTLQPIVAIGGMTTARIRQLDLAKCRCVAIISAIAGARDPQGAMKEIQQLIEGES